MPITFRSKHSPDILMLEAAGLELITLMGHGGSVPGALAARDIPAALQRLKRAVGEDPARPLVTDRRDSANAASREFVIGIAHRALPLIQMLETAIKESDHVIWDR